MSGRAAAAPDGGIDEVRTRFEAALELLGKDDARAADRMEALAAELPDSEYAPDALVEAAEVQERRLGHPDRARDLYARVAERYPGSRLSLRARARLAFLDENLRTGAAPLGEYQRILGGYAGRPPAESQHMMERLVAEYPGFALADRALLWLATLDARAGRFTDAESRFAEIERRFPGTEAALLARKGRADTRLAAGHPFEARALYRTLAAPGGPFPSLADGAQAGLAACHTAIWRSALNVASLAWLAAYLVGALYVARPLRPLRLGAELAYYLPVAALFVIAALTEARAIAIATASIACGGAAITYAATRAGTRRLERGPLGAAGWLAFTLATALAVTALAYAALHNAQLVDFVIDTIRDGPDR